jgi:hypothetical protein
MPVSRNCTPVASGRNVLGIDGLEALVNGLRERDEACELPSSVENWLKQWSFSQPSEKENIDDNVGSRLRQRLLG